MAIGTTLTVAFNGNAVKRGLSGMKRDMANVAKVAAGVGLAVAAIAAGLVLAAKKALDLGLAINKMGEESNTANARVHSIAKTIGVFGDEAVKVGNRLTALADKTARMVGVDEKQIKLTQAKILTFKALGKTADTVGGAFDRATMAAIDMAAAGFGTAEMNAVQLGKALEDPLRGLTALRRSGIMFTKAEEERIAVMVKANRLGEAQAEILAAIEKQIGGTAAATADGSARIAVGMEQVKRSFAMGFANAFSDVPGQLEGVFESMIERVKPIGTRIGNIVADALRGDTSDLVHAAALLGEAIGSAIKTGTWAGLRGFGAGIADHLTSQGEIRGFDGQVLREGQKSTRARDASSELLKRDIEDIMDNFRIASAQIMAREAGREIRHGNEILRPTRGGESPDIILRGESFKVLRKIEEHLRPAM